MLINDYLVVKIIIISQVFVVPRTVIIACEARRNNCLHFLFLTHRFILYIQQVKSRTKEFAYGLYWKQNRKNCIAFLSLESKLSMEAHMRWVDCQIQNLETYRKGNDLLWLQPTHAHVAFNTSFPLLNLSLAHVKKHVSLRHNWFTIQRRRRELKISNTQVSSPRAIDSLLFFDQIINISSFTAARVLSECFVLPRTFCDDLYEKQNIKKKAQKIPSSWSHMCA